MRPVVLTFVALVPIIAACRVPTQAEPATRSERLLACGESAPCPSGSECVVERLRICADGGIGRDCPSRVEVGYCMQLCSTEADCGSDGGFSCLPSLIIDKKVCSPKSDVVW